MRSVYIKKHGNPKIFNMARVEEPKPGEGQVLIRHSAVGVNYFDILQRSGEYPLSKLPTVLGFEGCGYVEAVGPKVSGFKVGERVAYGCSNNGSYSEKRVIHERYLVGVPKNISDEMAAASMTKGMMAHLLLFRVFMIRRAKVILVHAAAGGVGQFLCQWAKSLGVKVIGCVGDDAKIAVAKANGCSAVINYEKEDFVKKVIELTKGSGVPVIYDGVGGKRFLRNFSCLSPMGLCVSFGESGGKVPAFNIDYLTNSSLFLTRPSIFNYKANRMELVLSANEVFKMIGKGLLKPNINRYSLEKIPHIHRDMEMRKTVGSNVIIF